MLAQVLPPLCTQCAGGNTWANTTCQTGYTINGPTYLSWAKSPFGPWSKPQRLFAGQSNQTTLDTNLAATILANGSVVGIGRTGGPPTGIIAHLVTARDWRNASAYVGQWGQMQRIRERSGLRMLCHKGPAGMRGFAIKKVMQG